MGKSASGAPAGALPEARINPRGSAAVELDERRIAVVTEIVAHLPSLWNQPADVLSSVAPL
jgi:hypothetical protein